jgi:hypothetical protein
MHQLPGFRMMVVQLLLKTDFGVKRSFHDACALQMNRKRSAGQKRVLAEALEKKRRSTVPEASSAAAPVDSGTPAAPATATGCSSTDVVTELLGTIALDQPAASEAMALGGNAAQAPVVNPPAAAPVDSGTAAAPATASSSTDAPLPSPQRRTACCRWPMKF